MNETLEVIVETIAIISFAATVLNYTIIKPLRVAIDTLAGEVRDLKKVLDDVDHRLDRVYTRVTVNEERLKTLDTRVTTLESYHKQPISGGKYS